MSPVLTRIITVLCAAAAALASAAADDSPPAASPQRAATGFSLTATYYSNYIWRGIEFYNRGGALTAFAAWSPEGTGLTITLGVELSADYLWNGFAPRPRSPLGRGGRYYYDGAAWHRKTPKINGLAFASQTLDCGLDYSYTVGKLVTVGAGLWYFWSFNSAHANETGRPRAVAAVPITIAGAPAGTVTRTNYERVDWSFLTPMLSIALPALPVLNPKLTIIYDHYPAMKRSGDWYAQLALSQDFTLSPGLILTPGASAAYYYSRTARVTYWYYDGRQEALGLPGLTRSHTPLKKGLSDLCPAVNMRFTHGMATLTAGFTWVIVPAKSWYKGGAVHRYYAQVGGSIAP